MQKNIILAILIALGTGFPSLSTESFGKDVIIEYNPQVARVKVLPSSNLEVTPLTAQTFVNFKANSYDEMSHFFSIQQGDVIFSPPLEFFAAQEAQRFIMQNPCRIKVRTDLTTFPEIHSSESYHYFHNDGYRHAANIQTYNNCFFGFEGHALVKLNPQSVLVQQVRQIQQGQDNPWINLFANLALNHISSGDVDGVHQSNVNSGCAISSVMIRPYEGIKRDVPVNGHLSYGDTFKMDLSIVGATVEFQPNVGYKFNILD